MRLNGGDVFVESGVAFKGKTAMPIVRLTVTDAEEGRQVVLHLSPGKARSIAGDLFTAGSSAWAESAIRTYAQDTGIDGDTLIGLMKILTEADIKEPE